MLTFSVIQIFLSAIGSVSATLYKYHYANLVAQVFMVVFNLVPVDIARLLGILTLSLGSLSSLFCWFLSFVRFWRYLFFPTRQNFVFFFECIFNFLLITIQLIFFLYQAKQLSEPRKDRKLKYKHYLYTYRGCYTFLPRLLLWRSAFQCRYLVRVLWSDPVHSSHGHDVFASANERVSEYFTRVCRHMDRSPCTAHLHDYIYLH